MEKSDSEKKLMGKVKTYLGYRPHSEHELKMKLIKHFNEQEIEQALLIAKQNKWIPKPEEMARQLANELHKKKKGWLFIQTALKKKRLPPIQKQEEVEEEKGQWWLEKKFNKTQNPSGDTIKKMHRFLTYRGFEGEIIKKIIHDFLK